MPKHSLELPQVLRINGCEKLKQELDDIIADRLELTVSAANLEEIDAAGAQLLAALQMEIENREGSIIWEQPGSVLEITASTLGFPKLG